MDTITPSQHLPKAQLKNPVSTLNLKAGAHRKQAMLWWLSGTARPSILNSTHKACHTSGVPLISHSIPPLSLVWLKVYANHSGSVSNCCWVPGRQALIHCAFTVNVHSPVTLSAGHAPHTQGRGRHLDDDLPLVEKPVQSCLQGKSGALH